MTPSEIISKWPAWKRAIVKLIQREYEKGKKKARSGDGIEGGRT